MSSSTVVLFTRFGLGQAPADLQQKMVDVFLISARQARYATGQAALLHRGCEAGV